MKLLIDNINIKHVFFKEHVLSNEELRSAINELSSFLNKNYNSDSPFVFISAYNHIKTLISFYAVLKTGKIAVIVNPGVKSIELTEIINETDPAAMILINNETFRFDFNEEILFRNKSTGLIINSSLKDVVVLMYTNAENGRAKAAMLTENNLISAITTWANSDQITGENNICALVPYFHILGLSYGLILPNYIGCSVFIADLNLLRLTDLLYSLNKAGVDYMFSVPSVYYLISRIPGVESILVHIKDFLSGGIKMPLKVYDMFYKNTGKKIREGYGLTEASPGITLARKDNENNPESVGKVLPNCKVQILDDNGKVCRNDQIGELFVKGSNVFKGYLNDNNLDKTLMDGWFGTGDMVSMDKNDNLYFHGLKKNMLNVAGNNVYPKEIERLLKMNKQVVKVQIFSEQSMLQGDVIGAEVELKEPSENNISLFKEWCNQNITNYKIPKIWDIKK